MNYALSFIDKIIRGIALVTLIPFALVALIMSVLATDSPSSGILPMYVFLVVSGVTGALIFFSSIRPETIEKPFLKFGYIANILGRLPAYIYAPFGFYYGGRIMLNVIF